MARKTSSACVIIVAAVLIAGGNFASAQDKTDEHAASKAPPDTIKVTKRPYDRKALLKPPAMSEGALNGRAVFLQRCAYCHDGVGQPSYQTLGPWLGAETIERFTEDGFRAFVANGTERMPGWQYSLSSQQVNEVIAFLRTVSSDQKPTAAQLAGKGAGNSVGSSD
jgi:mono/diheme cytochrome c family protein